MNAKKLFVGTITGTILFFLLNLVVNSFFLTDFLANHQGLSPAAIRTQDVLPFTIMSHVMASFFLTYIFSFANVKTIIGGVILSFIIAFFVKSSICFHLYATTTILSKYGILAEVICFTFVTSIVGGGIIMIGDFSENAQVVIENETSEIRIN